MIQVTIGNNLKRSKVLVEEAKTVREILEENDLDYTNGSVNLDGVTLRPGDLDKTLPQHGITERCTLTVIVKADGAC